MIKKTVLLTLFLLIKIVTLCSYEELMLKRYPENSSCWEDIEVIELVLNQEGYERLQYGGLVKMGGLAINCYVKDILRPNILE